jgi:glucose uptake protein GlcU
MVTKINKDEQIEFWKNKSRELEKDLKVIAGTYLIIIILFVAGFLLMRYLEDKQDKQMQLEWYNKGMNALVLEIGVTGKIPVFDNRIDNVSLIRWVDINDICSQWLQYMQQEGKLT